MNLPEPILVSYAESELTRARFAAGVRAIVRHKFPGINPESILTEVLNGVAAATAGGETPSEQTLVTVTRKILTAATRKQALKNARHSKKYSNHTAIDITGVGPQTREILARFYGMGQSETQIGDEMATTVDAIREVRRRARDLNQT